MKRNGRYSAAVSVNEVVNMGWLEFMLESGTLPVEFK